MSRFEKQLKANCSPGAHSSLHEGASRPCIPVSDMQPDDVGQVCVEAARSLAASLRARSAQISQKLRRNADTLYTAIFESLHIESFFRKVTLLNFFFLQLLAELFIPADKIERFIQNGVSGRDLLDFSDEDLKGSDLQLTAIQVCMYIHTQTHTHTHTHTHNTHTHTYTHTRTHAHTHTHTHAHTHTQYIYIYVYTWMAQLLYLYIYIMCVFVCVCV